MRLTKNDNGLYFDDDCICPQTNDIIDKLGQLEDIEDELGIDLITLFKVLNADKVYNRQYGYYDLCSIDIKEKTIWFDNEKVVDKKPIDTLLLKDYGKTWALTKEELK